LCPQGVEALGDPQTSAEETDNAKFLHPAPYQCGKLILDLDHDLLDHHRVICYRTGQTFTA